MKEVLREILASGKHKHVLFVGDPEMSSISTFTEKTRNVYLTVFPNLGLIDSKWYCYDQLMGTVRNENPPREIEESWGPYDVIESLDLHTTICYYNRRSYDLTAPSDLFELPNLKPINHYIKHDIIKIEPCVAMFDDPHEGGRVVIGGDISNPNDNCMFAIELASRSYPYHRIINDVACRINKVEKTFKSWRLIRGPVEYDTLFSDVLQNLDPITSLDTFDHSHLPTQHAYFITDGNTFFKNVNLSPGYTDSQWNDRSHSPFVLTPLMAKCLLEKVRDFCNKVYHE